MEGGEKFKPSKQNMGALFLDYLEKLISNKIVSDHKLAAKSIEQFI